jgi:hypothetical protein
LSQVSGILRQSFRWWGNNILRAKQKKVRTAGQIPTTYSGPIYWRLTQFHPVMGPTEEPIRFTDSQDRLDRLWLPREKMPGKNIFNSGTVFGDDGEILPEWHTPIRAKWIKPGPVRVEYSPGKDVARVSERVLDVLNSIDSHKHHTFPIDIECQDGSVERRYYVYFAADANLEARELHPEANKLKPLEKPVAGYRFLPPMWLSACALDQEHFGYLDASAVGDLVWFKGTDTNHYFSQKLFESLASFGDIFPRWYVALPIGFAG